MRKVKMLNRVSLDGYFASLDEVSFGMNWFIHDPKVDIAAHEWGGKMNTLLLGGATFRLFEQFWVPILDNPGAPAHMRETAVELTEMTKVVFSRKIDKVDWANTQIVRGQPADQVLQMKAGPGSDMLVLGSGSIVQQLVQEGLIDDYLLIVTPVVLGEGRPLFPQGSRFGLQLQGVRSFDSGNVLLHYAR